MKEKGKGLFEEFKKFVLRGNVLDLSVGVIIGTAFAGLIGAFTDDFINPLINGIGGAEVAGRIKIYGGQYLNWGHFVTQIINFLIMAFVLFLILKSVNKLMSLGKKKEEAAPKKSDEVVLLEQIRDELKKRK